MQVPGTGYDDGGRQLGGGGGKLKKGSEEFDVGDKDPGKLGGRPKDIRVFFKAVVQVVLLFGSETWVLTPLWSGTWAVSSTGSRSIRGSGPTSPTRKVTLPGRPP